MIFLLCFLSGCASINTPKKWLLLPEDVPSDPYGTWIETEYYNDNNRIIKISGELIALDKDSLYLLNDYFETLSVLNIKSAKIAKYDSEATTLGNLTVLGSISSCSNGWFLVFTFPIWLIGGSISTSTRSYEPILEYPRHKLTEFSQYARFPQGLPEPLNRKGLYPKNYKKPFITEKDTSIKN